MTYITQYPIKRCSHIAAPFILTDEDRYGVSTPEDLHSSIKYPFDLLQIGDSFTVPYDAVRLPTLRSATSRAHYGKRFKLLRHDKIMKYEVVRIR